ncbi:MAG: hypothetical protein K2H74_03405, partial [Paramuribaculum sp.]|nr:hypothetical protein [Paramuribaculum sp.]
LTTIRNQESEIETLNKEVSSMRKNIEHFNEEHLLRGADAKKAEPKAEPKTKEAKAPKTTKAKAEPKPKAAKAKAGKKAK